MAIEGCNQWSRLDFCLLASLVSGVFPDQLHILDLAIYNDIFSSTLILLTDSEEIFSGSSRDDRLEKIWLRYARWCADNSALHFRLQTMFD